MLKNTNSRKAPVSIVPLGLGSRLSHTPNPRGFHFDGEGNEGGEGEGDPEPEMKLTQSALDKMIARRVSSVEKKYLAEKTTAETKMSDLMAELEKLKKTPEKKETPGNPDPEKYIPKSEWEAQSQKLNTDWETKVTGLSKKVESLLGEKKRSAVISAASRANSVDPEMIAKLVSENVAFDDDDSLFFKDSKGEPRIGPKGEYLTADEYVTEFLSDKPYLVKSGANPGGGSDRKVPGSKVDPNKSPLDKMTSGLKALNS